jgi:hypothetical protein
MNRTVVFPRGFTETVEIEAVVFFGKKGCLSVVAPLDDVLRVAHHIESRFACHTLPFIDFW